MAGITQFYVNGVILFTDPIKFGRQFKSGQSIIHDYNEYIVLNHIVSLGDSPDIVHLSDRKCIF